MDQLPVSVQVAEDISEGMSCLYKISSLNDASCSPVLSKMRDALWIMKQGVQVRTSSQVDEDMIKHLDQLIAYVGVKDFDMPKAREMAKDYLAELDAKWRPTAPKDPSAK